MKIITHISHLTGAGDFPRSQDHSGTRQKLHVAFLRFQGQGAAVATLAAEYLTLGVAAPGPGSRAGPLPMGEELPASSNQMAALGSQKLRGGKDASTIHNFR